MFVARPDHKLIVADYGQMELRMIAHYSQDEEFLRAFEEGLDLHVVTGARQAGLTYDELLERCQDEHDIEAKMARMIGKTSNFALSYGMGPKKFQLRLFVDNGVYVSVEEARRLIDDFNSTYSQATEWKQATVREAHRNGYITTLARRRRHLPNLKSDDSWRVREAERQAVNAKIQGGCADVVAAVIPLIQNALRPLGGYVLLQCHDEVVSEVPTPRAELAARLTETIMTGLINPKLVCPLVANAHIGASWGSAKG